MSDSGPIPLVDESGFSRKTLEAINAKFKEGDQRMARMEGDMSRLQSGLVENTEITRRIESNTADLVEAITSLQGMFKVLSWLVKAAVPLGLLWGGIKAYTLGVFK